MIRLKTSPKYWKFDSDLYKIKQNCFVWCWLFLYLFWVDPEPEPPSDFDSGFTKKKADSDRLHLCNTAFKRIYQPKPQGVHVCYTMICMYTYFVCYFCCQLFCCKIPISFGFVHPPSRRRLFAESLIKPITALLLSTISWHSRDVILKQDRVSTRSNYTGYTVPVQDPHKVVEIQ